MAVARAQVAGGGMNGTKVALIVFVVVTVLALGGLVYLFTQQSDLVAREEQAIQGRDTANQQASQAKSTLSAMSMRFLGESVEEPERMQQAVQTALAPVLKDERVAKEVPPDASVMTVLQGLYKLYAANAELLAKTTAERNQLNDQLKKLTESVAAREQQFQQTAEQLQKQYQALEQQTATNREAWNAQVEDLKKRLESAGTTAGNQLNQERQARVKLEQQLEQKDKRVNELLESLASYRPAAGQTSVLQMADGTIVRAVAGSGLVYISLGAQDGVKPGMTFSVYSKSRPVAENGKGKASIEVVSVFDRTSEAKVTSTTRGDPILEGDVIVNPVYDKQRQLNFAVAGDFDLDFDGIVDDPDGQKVAGLIERWGGKVMQSVDTRTDFVVLGNPPMQPPKLAADADDASRQRGVQLEAAYKAFESIKNEARSLSIPIMTRTQFLRFIGTPVPANTKEDKPAT